MKTERFEELKKDTNTPFEERSSINLINQVASDEQEHQIMLQNPYNILSLNEFHKST